METPALKHVCQQEFTEEGKFILKPASSNLKELDDRFKELTKMNQERQYVIPLEGEDED